MMHKLVEAAALAAVNEQIEDTNLNKLFDGYRTCIGSPIPEDCPIYYRFLYHLSRLRPSMTMVELGFRNGAASLHFLRGGGKAVLGIDHEPVHNPLLFKHLDYAIIAGDSVSIVSVATAQAYLGTIDIVFIDTNHGYQETRAEYDLWKPVVRKGGLIMLDDICYAGLPRVWREIKEDKLALPQLHPPADLGFGVVFV